ncbi:hypothetical protein NDU88_004459 [Pleurodeles waltl]|uniref:Uncharacterized protein n=1 Tax=Pleurodeles waltl TaxID=8319 RepID=A0AAV7W871_PLEWA|nr:hypothetical protein NDU88_004459 [Pleurodeles waltl]
MSAGRHSHAREESGVAGWSRAALELRRSRRAAARVSFRAIGGRGSTITSCPAIPRELPLLPMLECAEPRDPDRHSSKSAHDVGAYISSPLPARSLSAKTYSDGIVIKTTRVEIAHRSSKDGRSVTTLQSCEGRFISEGAIFDGQRLFFPQPLMLERAGSSMILKPLKSQVEKIPFLIVSIFLYISTS